MNETNPTTPEAGVSTSTAPAQPVESLLETKRQQVITELDAWLKERNAGLVPFLSYSDRGIVAALDVKIIEEQAQDVPSESANDPAN